MNDENQAKPYHAKDTAPGQEAADVVAEVLQHAAEREEAAKQKVVTKGPPKWMLPVTLNLGVLALYFLIVQPDFLVLNPNVDPRTTEQVTDGVRRAIVWEGVTKIASFQQTNGRLPATLDEAGLGTLAAQGITYSTIGDSTYILVATVNGEVITYDSASTDINEFLGPVNLPG